MIRAIARSLRWCWDLLETKPLERPSLSPAQTQVERLLSEQQQGNVHDYTKRYWGHDYSFAPRGGGHYGHAMGWGYGIHVGDLLLLDNKLSARRDSLYRVLQIKYFSDPPDMWTAELEWVPREAKAVN